MINKMRYPRILSQAFMVLTLSVFLACTSNKGTSDPTTPSTDGFKTGMLTNYADNIIIPSYDDLTNKLTALEAQVNSFLDQPSAATLEATKPAFKAAYLSYENTSAAYFGPAGALLLNNYLNTFPAVPSKIEQAVTSGTYNLELPVVNDSIQGFPTLDYLLFAPNAVVKFSGTGAVARKKYVKDVLTRMKGLVANTHAQWKGTYRTTFINSLKTDVGSSIGFLVNQFAYEMDVLKGPRIGWPFGKLSNGRVFADKSEGYYSFSKNPIQVEEAYRQVQKLLTLIKTDVASATSIQITYQDNDGD